MWHVQAVIKCSSGILSNYLVIHKTIVKEKLEKNRSLICRLYAVRPRNFFLQASRNADWVEIVVWKVQENGKGKSRRIVFDYYSK